MKNSEYLQYQHKLTFLRDGKPVRLRPIMAEDKTDLAAAFERLSFQSRYQRFLAPVAELSMEMLVYLTEIDYVNHFAWGAFALAEEHAPLIGVARYIRLDDDPLCADVAIAVIDRYQQRGLGMLLLRALAEVAVQNGIRSFVGNSLAENRAIMPFLRRAKARTAPEGSGVFRFVVDLDESLGEMMAESSTTFVPRSSVRISCGK
jgi:GNAT superfamily N-acetyltransferase